MLVLLQPSTCSGRVGEYTDEVMWYWYVKKVGKLLGGDDRSRVPAAAAALNGTSDMWSKVQADRGSASVEMQQTR